MNNTNLVWIDMEMTGLNPQIDQILEIASIITDSDLNIIAEGSTEVIHCPVARLEAMDDWNRKHHKESGLWDKSLASTTTVAEAEATVLKFISQYAAQGSSPLCGNSVWQDRRFLLSGMPALESYLHYRLIDVSSFKEVLRRWYPETSKYEKKGRHRALDDIRESIDELKFYRQNFLTVPKN